MSRVRNALASMLIGGALAACTPAPQQETASAKPTPPSTPSSEEASQAPAAVNTPAADAVAADPALPPVIVHKSPTCGCCTAWVEHMRQNGFTVQVNDIDNLEPIKRRLGVPFGKGSCHTAEVGPYFIEGHVPAEDIKRLLAEGGDSRGLVLPGMPIGSPGMEVPDGRVERYTVERVDAQGATHPFATHGE